MRSFTLFRSATAVLVFLGLGGLGGLSQEVSPMAPIESTLEKEYDLGPRQNKGDSSYYSYSDRFSHWGPDGRIARQEFVTGYFTQEVIGFRHGGAPVFKVVRNHTEMRTASGEEGVSSPVSLEFGEGFTYEVCFEDDFDYFSVDTSTFPNTLPGFMMFENIVHSHTFAVLASRTHGALDKLRKVGATVTIPDSGKSGQVEFPGFISVKLVRGQSTMTFLGLSEHRGEPVALLSYDIPLEFPSIAGGTGMARATGLIWFSLRRGEILKGMLRQTTQLALPGPEGQPVASYVEAEGLLEKISREEYPILVD
jgi:hypothetical protein